VFTLWYVNKNEQLYTYFYTLKLYEKTDYSLFFFSFILSLVFIFIISFLTWQQYIYQNNSWIVIIFTLTEFNLRNKQLIEAQKSLQIYKNSEQHIVSAEQSNQLMEPLKERIISDFNHQSQSFTPAAKPLEQSLWHPSHKN